jgi:alpha-tubulin suppressor-like RCC1 family protein
MNNWQYFDNTKELLEFIAKEYGIDSLLKGKNFSDHADATLPQWQKNLVKQAFDCGAIKILQGNINDDQKNREIAVKQTVQKLVDTYRSSKEDTEQIVWGFTNALGWGLPEPKVPIKQSPISQPSAPLPVTAPPPQPVGDIGKLMKRAWQFAEDGDWNDAADYFNKVLDDSTDYTLAFLGLLCVDLKVSAENKLAHVKTPDFITNHKHYKRAITDSATKSRLDGYIQTIKDRIKAEQDAAVEVARRKNVLDFFVDACKVMKNAKTSNDYRKVINSFNAINSNYQDINEKIEEKIEECEKKYAAIEVEQKELAEKKHIAKEKRQKEDEKRNKYRDCISTGYYTLALKRDGTVFSSDRNNNQYNVQDWQHILSISTSDNHAVGLKVDGTVVATGLNDKGQCDVGHWHDIVAVSADDFHTVGLKKSGNVVAVGCNDDGECNTDNWSGIVAIYTTYKRTIGLTKDGNVIVCGVEKQRYNSSEWKDIKAISKCGNIGIKYNNSLVGIGECGYVIKKKPDIWQNIITAANSFEIGLFGLKEDGTVTTLSKAIPEIHKWQDIVDISMGYGHIFGLKKDGTVIAAGDNSFKQCEVSNWKNVVCICANAFNTMGLKSNGTILVTGNNINLSEYSTWSNIGPPNKEELNEQAIRDEKKKYQYYEQLIQKMEIVSSEKDFLELSKKFQNMKGYKNTVALAEECEKKYQQKIEEKQYENYTQLLEKKNILVANNISNYNIADFNNLAKEFLEMYGYKNTYDLYDECKKEAENRQSMLWKSQGLCRYCGNQLGIFKKCKSKDCNQKN